VKMSDLIKDYQVFGFGKTLQKSSLCVGIFMTFLEAQITVTLGWLYYFSFAKMAIF